MSIFKKDDFTIKSDERGNKTYPCLKESYNGKISLFKEIFKEIDPIKYHEISIGEEANIKACLIFCDGLINSEIVNDNLIRPLTKLREIPKGENLGDAFLSQVFQVNDAKKTSDVEEITMGVLYGDTLIFIDGIDDAFIFSTKKFEIRSITEPEGEVVLSGPREGFTEVLMANLSMVRRKIRTTDLKMKFLSLGKQSRTQLCVAYIDGIVDNEVLKELYMRLEKIDIDGILDANYINELIKDKKASPFRSIGYTERPDVIAAKMLEGRIAIFIDGTPVVLTVPYLFIENFQSNDDYYQNYYYASVSRLIRILGFFLATLVPGVYVAMEAYHQEMLPAPLLLSMAAERHSVPLPASLEAFIMLIAFEILRETGLRMQTNIGQALSIVGALVVGQAAVQAELVAAPMIIIVAVTGITSLLIPKMSAPLLLIRFGTLVLASCFGFLGVTISFTIVLVHILMLDSFGIWQFNSSKDLKWQEFKDMIIRAPWSQMIHRPEVMTDNVIRQNAKEES